MVFVVGCEGVGKSKTTLANKLYCRIGGQFECRAFVWTSRKPDVRRLLMSMLSQVRAHQTPHTWKVHSLIADIKTHLQDKRYLVVIDDVWARSFTFWMMMSRTRNLMMLDCSSLLFRYDAGSFGWEDICWSCGGLFG